jgi:acetolactate synthase-1/2/3 large subunit
MRSYNPVKKGHGGQIRKAVQLLLSAKRPYIYTGGGVVLGNASAELRSWSTCWASLHQHADGAGRMPASDPRFLGMLGMHGTYEANMTMQHCDVLLAVGARFDDRVIGNPKHFASVERKIIHVDIDPSSISKRVQGRHPDRRRRQGRAAGTHQRSWRGTVQGGRAGAGGLVEQIGVAQARLPAYKNSDEVIKPQFVVEKLWS